MKSKKFLVGYASFLSWYLEIVKLYKYMQVHVLILFELLHKIITKIWHVISCISHVISSRRDTYFKYWLSEHVNEMYTCSALTWV